MMTIHYVFRFIRVVETEPNRYSQLSWCNNERNSRTHRYFFFSSKPGMMIFFSFSHHHLLPVARLSSCCCCCRPVRRFNTPISGSPPPLLTEFKFRLWRQKRGRCATNLVEAIIIFLKAGLLLLYGVSVWRFYTTLYVYIMRLYI